jgi:hypothetical protein
MHIAYALIQLLIFDDLFHNFFSCLQPYIVYSTTICVHTHGTPWLHTYYIPNSFTEFNCGFQAILTHTSPLLNCMPRVSVLDKQCAIGRLNLWYPQVCLFHEYEGISFMKEHKRKILIFYTNKKITTPRAKKWE